MSQPASLALEVRDLTKSFAGVTALDGVDLEVRAGEVHALLGQNGCGKSTLVKALTGVIQPDSGNAALYGSPLEFGAGSTPGIAVVHQDVGLADGMTVIENLGATSSYGARLLGVVRARRERATFGALMESLGVHLPFDALVADLDAADRAMLGVLRALRTLSVSEGRQLLILDEPTAALSRDEAAAVLTMMRRVAERGSAVIFISHRLAEVAEYCDRVTVMRDGRSVLTGAIRDLDRDEIVMSMLGRSLDDFVRAAPLSQTARTRLVIDGLRGGRLLDFTATVAAGELVGVTGLAGMGQDEVADLISGVRTPAGGSIEVDDEVIVTGSPSRAIEAGIVLVPADRIGRGGWMAATARENLTLPTLKRFARLFGLDDRRERRESHRLLESVQLRPLDPERTLESFSGGNQQKVVFAKWLATDPQVLVLHEPTQGVDAGASREIMTQITSSAAKGVAIVLVSSDHELLTELCHRVLVLSHGAITEEIPRSELSEQRIMTACSV